MGRGQFTAAEIETLRDNPYVYDVNQRSISYSKEFKLRFMKEYSRGKQPVRIFQDAGFDPKMLGSKRIERASARWKEAYESGTLGRKEAVLHQESEAEKEKSETSEKPGSNKKDLVRLCREQEKTIRTLKMEVEFLKRVCGEEASECPNALPASEICRIIGELAQQEEYAGCVSHLCEMAGISRGLYYHYKHRRERSE